VRQRRRVFERCGTACGGWWGGARLARSSGTYNVGRLAMRCERQGEGVSARLAYSKTREMTDKTSSRSMRESRRRTGIWPLVGYAALGVLALARGHLSRRVGSERRSTRKDVARHETGGEEDRWRKIHQASEPGRGRDADTPADIPPRGWQDITLRVYHNITKDRVITIAAGVTFYSLLAVFPAIAALVAIYGLFVDPASISHNVDSLSGLLPGGAIDVIREQMTRIASRGKSTLGFAFAVGLLVSLWSANAGIKSLFDSLNLVYNEEEKRGLIKLNLVSLTFTLAAIVFVLSGIAAVVVLPAALNYIGLGGASDIIVRIGRWPVLFILVALALALIYRYGPSRSKPKWRWITWGSAFAALVWIVASLLFSWYAANFGSYNETYGSLGAVIGLMIWLWLSTVVTLVGAELDAEMEHQTARDTTIGPPTPLGARGAAMANSVGPAQN
jgi:membrane protein